MSIRKEETEKMEEHELVYNMLLCKIALFKQQLERVTIYKKKNFNEHLITSFVFYLTDKKGNLHTEKFHLFDDSYLWLLCAMQEDFPDVLIMDIGSVNTEVDEYAV